MMDQLPVSDNNGMAIGLRGDSFIERKLFCGGEGGPLFDRSWAGIKEKSLSESSTVEDLQYGNTVEKVLLRGAELRAFETQMYPVPSNMQSLPPNVEPLPPNAEKYLAFEDSMQTGILNHNDTRDLNPTNTGEKAVTNSFNHDLVPSVYNSDGRYILLTEDDFISILSDSTQHPPTREALRERHEIKNQNTHAEARNDSKNRHVSFGGGTEKANPNSKHDENNGSLGIRLGQTPKGEVIIAKLQLDGPAHRDGRIKVGDLLLSIKTQSGLSDPSVASNLAAAKRALVGPAGTLAAFTIGRRLIPNDLEHGSQDMIVHHIVLRRDLREAEPITQVLSFFFPNQ